MWRACQQRENSLIDYYVSDVLSLSASGISVKASLIKETNCRHQIFFFTCLVSSITMLQSIQESKARKYPKRRKQTGFKLQLSRYETMFTFACGGLWKFLLNNSSVDWMTQPIGFFRRLTLQFADLSTRSAQHSIRLSFCFYVINSQINIFILSSQCSTTLFPFFTRNVSS